MFLLLTYDIDQSDNGKNLRKIAKECEKYGVRVQNSVFEMNLDPAEITKLKSSLEKIMNPDTDSIRIYKIGKVENVKIDILGQRENIEISRDNALFF